MSFSKKSKYFFKKMIDQISHDEFLPDNGKDNFDIKWS